MPAQRPRIHGILAVSLMALHSRAFFRRLLADPRKALTPGVRHRLGLTPADVKRVVKVVTAGRSKIQAAEAVKAWDLWHRTGVMDESLWPAFLWPI